MLDFPTQKKLLEPILKHPSNHICADCNTRSPTWASLDFGVFLCSNCSGAHRALGPTITRVKSANLDLWHEQWVASMVLGNEQINEYWEGDSNAMAKKPKMGASPEEIRRYVYDKYVKKKYVKDTDEEDPLSIYKKGPTAASNEKMEAKVEEQPRSFAKEQPIREKSVEQQRTFPVDRVVQPKKEVSLLDFDIELHPPPVQPVPQQHEEEQFTSYTECGTSFTSETSKENFVDFNTLLQSHKQAEGQMHHSLSTQAVFQHALYNNNQPYYNPGAGQSIHYPHQQLQTSFHQNYPSFTHQNYFQHPSPPVSHHSPPNHPTFTQNYPSQQNSTPSANYSPALWKN